MGVIGLMACVFCNLTLQLWLSEMFLYKKVIRKIPGKFRERPKMERVRLPTVAPY
jgi:hypothetical protein